MARGKMKGVFKDMPRNKNYPDVFGKTLCGCGESVPIKIDNHGFLYVYCPKDTGCGTKTTTQTVGGVKIIISKATGLIPESADNYREYVKLAQANIPQTTGKPSSPVFVDPADKPEASRKKPELEPDKSSKDDVDNVDNDYDDFTE